LHTRNGDSDDTEYLVANQTLTARIEQALEQEADLHLAVQESAGRITISGMVDSDEARDTALEIAARLAPNRTIEPDIDVTVTLVVEEGAVSLPPAGNLADTIVEVNDANRELVADFSGDPGSTDERTVIQDGEEPYFPPTDPVVASDASGNLEVIGGWTGTSTSEVEVAASAIDGQPGDEALRDAVRRELRQDAATTMLDLRVTVRDGVVHLRGTVADLEDAENAEAVAAGVPGVVEVIEELDVQTA
jgi:osmotically-inducible protein OsmY